MITFMCTPHNENIYVHSRMKIPLLRWCLCWIYSDKSQLEMLVLCRQMRCCGITIDAGVNTTNVFVISRMVFSSSGVWPEPGLIELDQPKYYLMRWQKKLLVSPTHLTCDAEGEHNSGVPVGQIMSKLGHKHNKAKNRCIFISYNKSREERRAIGG